MECDIGNLYAWEAWFGVDSPVYIVYSEIIYLQYEFACDILD